MKSRGLCMYEELHIRMVEFKGAALGLRAFGRRFQLANIKYLYTVIFITIRNSLFLLSIGYSQIHTFKTFATI